MIHDYRKKSSKSERNNLLMLLNYAYYSFAIKIKSCYDEKTHFSSEMHLVWHQFYKQIYDKTTQAFKKIKRGSIQKKMVDAFAYLCLLIIVMTRVEKGVIAVPAQGPAHPQQLQEWHYNLQHASLHYQLSPAACRKAQLYFHCVWWCFRVADYSWPVAMADVWMLTTPGPFIPNP